MFYISTFLLIPGVRLRIFIYFHLLFYIFTSRFFQLNQKFSKTFIIIFKLILKLYKKILIQNNIQKKFETIDARSRKKTGKRHINRLSIDIYTIIHTRNHHSTPKPQLPHTSTSKLPLFRQSRELTHNNTSSSRSPDFCEGPGGPSTRVGGTTHSGYCCRCRLCSRKPSRCTVCLPRRRRVLLRLRVYVGALCADVFFFDRLCVFSAAMAGSVYGFHFRNRRPSGIVRFKMGVGRLSDDVANESVFY